MCVDQRTLRRRCGIQVVPPGIRWYYLGRDRCRCSINIAGRDKSKSRARCRQKSRERKEVKRGLKFFKIGFSGIAALSTVTSISRHVHTCNWKGKDFYLGNKDNINRSKSMQKRHHLSLAVYETVLDQMTGPLRITTRGDANKRRCSPDFPCRGDLQAGRAD